MKTENSTNDKKERKKSDKSRVELHKHIPFSA